MKSIRTRIIATALAVGLLTMAPARVQAQAMKVIVTLTATYQDPNPKQPPASNPNITPSDTKSGKITSVNMLSLLSASAGPFPSGSYLSYDLTSGAIGALDSKGDFEDLSTAITITPDASGNGLLTSSSNEDPTDAIAQTITDIGDAQFTFTDGNGNSFTVSGILKATSSLAKGDAAGDPQTETISFSGSVAGYGTYLGNNAVFTGTVSCSGKGAAGS
jgi:hypothetical protein